MHLPELISDPVRVFRISGKFFFFFLLFKFSSLKTKNSNIFLPLNSFFQFFFACIKHQHFKFKSKNKSYLQMAKICWSIQFVWSEESWHFNLSRKNLISTKATTSANDNIYFDKQKRTGCTTFADIWLKCRGWVGGDYFETIEGFT